jgi:hypothetical protein
MTDTEPDPTPPVPVNDAVATETDEETVLRELYGPPDASGVYMGGGA